MTNVAAFNNSDLLAVLGPAATHLPTEVVVRGVSTDTRTLEPGNAFIALIGERFDAHSLVLDAFEKGASLAVVDEQWLTSAPDSIRSRCVGVASTLHALGSFAWWHRKRFEIPVIAIGGAAGKTSTKDVVAHVLGVAMNVLKTPGNLNNQIGTPLTLLQLAPSHEAAVIEIGTNEPGEIETLCAMVQPTHGLITNIGKEHLEKLRDLDGVEREETALFDYLADHGGVAFVNNDDARLRQHAWRLTKCVTFGIDTDANVRPTVRFDAALHPDLHMVYGDFTFRAVMQTQGLAAARNAVCAVAIAWTLNCTADEVRLGLQTFQPPPSHGYARMSVEAIESLHNVVVLNDCYNANPESVTLALDTLARYPASTRIAVLGDMRELGHAAATEHADVLRYACSIADHVVLYGQEFQAALETTPFVTNAVWCSTHEACANAVRDFATAGTAVLVKGSRGCTMEHVITALRQV